VSREPIAFLDAADFARGVFQSRLAERVAVTRHDEPAAADRRRLQAKTARVALDGTVLTGRQGEALANLAKDLAHEVNKQAAGCGPDCVAEVSCHPPLVHLVRGELGHAPCLYAYLETVIDLPCLAAAEPAGAAVVVAPVAAPVAKEGE
jgi:hypothetical protein